MCAVASSSFTTALPLSGGNAPGKPSPLAWWQAEQLAAYKPAPLAASYPRAGAAAAAGADEFALGAALAVAPSPPAASLPAHGGCFNAAKYAIKACASRVGTTTPCAGA